MTFEVLKLEIKGERGGFRADIYAMCPNAKTKKNEQIVGAGTGLSRTDAITCAAANLERLKHRLENGE